MLLWWSIALCAIFLIGVTKSGFGSGVGLMIVPMMAISRLNPCPFKTHRVTLGHSALAHDDSLELSAPLRIPYQREGADFFC